MPPKLKRKKAQRKKLPHFMHVKEHKIIPNVMKRHKLTAKYTQQEKKKKRNRRNKQLSDSEYSGLKKKIQWKCQTGRTTFG